MSLGRPTRGLTLERLTPEYGKGNSLTCFAKHALSDWDENIPGPGVVSRRDRRDLICILARESFICPLEMLAIMIIKRREYRQRNRPRRVA